MKHILKCKNCGTYTMKDKCSCGSEAVKAGPAKYSPQDAYAKYRRAAKAEALKKAGLL